MLMGRPADAAAAYRRAADLRFDEPTMLRLVEALDRAGRRPEAAKVLALFLSQNPENVAALRLSGALADRGGRHGTAIDTLEMLRARIGDGDAALNADLAMAYSARTNSRRPRISARRPMRWRRAIRRRPTLMAGRCIGGGDAQAAVELLQKAVTLAPRHAGLRWHLAQVYADLNRKPEARAQAQAALADPRFGERDAATALVARS